ncbi:MAG TPA: glycosyltransferase [Gemmatirosa sp.]
MSSTLFTTTATSLHTGAARPVAAGGSAVEQTTIAFLHRGHDWIRGSEQCLLDLMARVDRSRFRPLLVCEQPTLARAAATIGADVVQLDPAVSDWTVLRSREARPALRKQLRDVFLERRVRIVHSNVSAILPIVIPVARSARLPVVCHLHLPVTDERNRRHELVHQADVTVGVAEHVVRPLRADGVAPERLRVIYNAVDTDRLGRGDARGLREALGIPDEALAVAWIGSLIYRKGPDVMLRAVAAARARGKDVRLLICGDGDEAEAQEYRALATALGLDASAHFLGYRTDVGAVMRDACDIFVSTAREEMLPLNVLEAQYVGIPVIASDIPAHYEATIPGTSAVLVRGEDPDALARAIVELADAPERRAAMRIAGPRVVAERFSMDRYVGAFEALYAELLARPRGDFGWVRGVYWPTLYTTWVRRNVRRRLGFGVARGGTANAALTT